jgi:hypothetical protein
MLATLPLLFALPLAGEAYDERITRARDWLSLDAYHVSRSLPSFSRVREMPINPGLQAGYHHAWFGKAVTGGTSLQASVLSFDQLFWSLSAGAGFEGIWRARDQPGYARQTLIARRADPLLPLVQPPEEGRDVAPGHERLRSIRRLASS